MTIKPQHAPNENIQWYVLIQKSKNLFKAPTVKKYSFIQKNKHYLTLSIVLYTRCGFHINHFRILLLTHYFIFLSFCCVFIFKWYPFGNPIFSVDQSEWICMKLYFGKKNSSSPLHHPAFLFQVLNVNCDTTYCYIWGSYGLFTYTCRLRQGSK